MSLRNALSIKTIAVLISALPFSGCFSEKNMQAEITEVRLIKIDTIYRSPGLELRLSWKCIKDNQVYVCQRPVSDSIPYKLGIRMISLRKM